jgi:hypothetical protein
MKLSVILPVQADELERFAASELRRYVQQLFGSLLIIA